jgi:hypothetical protein
MGQHLVDAHVHAENIFIVVCRVPAPVIISTFGDSDEASNPMLIS